MDPYEVIKSICHFHDDDNTPTMLKKMTRLQIPTLCQKLGYKVGAEVGVYRGHFTKYFFNAIPDLEMFCVDMWRRKRLYRDTIKHLDGCNVKLIRKKSVDGAMDIKDGSLDFVYIDAAHDFDNVVIDIITWEKKVRPGGLIAGHDYHHNYKYGVMEAVDAYTKCHSINKWFLTRDLTPNWFWIKK